MRFLLVLLLLYSANSIATQDVEDPEQVLSTLRKILSEPKVAANIEAYAKSGCRWSSESIWSGSGEQVSGDVWKHGSSVTFYFVTRSGDERKFTYTFNTVRNGSTLSIEDIRGGKNSEATPKC